MPFAKNMRHNLAKGRGIFLIVTAVILIGGFFIYNAVALTGVNVTSPVGEVYWRGTQDITWTADCEPGDLINIYYSTDNFTSQSVKIAGNIACDNLLYSWNTVAVAGNSNYKIKIRDASDPDVFDVSGAFTIDNTAPAIGASTLTSPNGGEFWAGGSSKNITWNSGDITDVNLGANPISLFYTTNGVDWNEIASGLANISPYSWTVPEIDFSTVKVKIIATDLAGNTSSDQSNADFTIDSTHPVFTNVAVTDPDEFYKAGDTISFDVNLGETGLTVTANLKVLDSALSETFALTPDGDGTYSGTSVALSDDTMVEGINTAVTLTATDAAGNSTTDSSLTLTIDKIPPTAAITYSDPDAIVKQGDSLTITATFNETMLDAPIVKIEISGSNTVAATNMTRTDATHYTYVHTVGVGNGAATVALSVGTDLAGNLITSVPTSGANFTIDNTAPATPIVTAPVAPLFVNADTYNITGTAEADSLVKIYNGVTPVGSQQLSGGATGYSILAALTQNAVNDLTVKATDAAGNESDGAAVPAITEDSIAPTVILSDDHPDNIVLNADAVLITATFSDTNGINETTVPKITIGGIVINADMTKTSNLVWTYSWDVPNDNDGSVVILISATDVAGNLNSLATGKNSYTIDNIAPSVALTYDLTRPVKNADTLLITATFNEPMAASPTIAIDTADTDLGATAMSGSGAIWTYSYNVPAGSDGAATITIVGTDIAGNANAVATNATFTIDNGAPVTPIITDPATPIFINADSYHIIGTAEANSLVKIYNGIDLLSSVQLAGDATNFDISVTLPQNAVNNFTATATDSAGNESLIATIPTITEDSTNPTVILSDNHTDDIVRNVNNVTITANFTDTNGTNETLPPTITIGTIVINTPMTKVNNLRWTYLWNVPSGNNGPISVSIAASDLAGNPNDPATGKTSYIIDNAVPTVTSVSSTNDNGYYKESALIHVTVTFSENVNVVGTPLLELETGVTDYQAAYVSGSGSNIFTFDYTVQAGDTSNDLNYISTTALTIGTGITIKDIAGNNANRNLPVLASLNSLAGNKQIVIDTTNPTVTPLAAPVAETVYITAPPLQFTPDDSGPGAVTCSYSIDGVATTSIACTKPTPVDTTMSGLADGRRSVVVTVTDAAGNTVDSGAVSFVYNDDIALDVPADFATIQEAINKATVGDTIDVAAGTYNETLSVTQSLIIQSVSGAATTIIDLGQPGETTGIALYADNVTFSGFTVTNISTNGAHAQYAIRVRGSNNTISNNIIIGQPTRDWWSMSMEEDSGINLDGTTATITANNTVENNEIYNFSAMGVQIVGSGGVYNSHDNIIQNNNIHNIDWYGIANDRSASQTITNNTLANIGPTGHVADGYPAAGVTVWGGQSTGTMINSQDVNGSEIGIALSAAQGITIQNSELSNNAVAGIRMSDSSWLPDAVDNNTIQNNDIHGNDTGIIVKSGGLGGVGAGNIIQNNKIYNNPGPTGIHNYSAQNINASPNWWGSAQKSSVESEISGDVTFIPWYLDDSLIPLSANPLSSSDVTGPTVELANDIGGRTQVSDIDIVVITATFSDDNGLDTGVTPEITITNGGVADVDMTATGNPNIWTYSWNVPAGNATANVIVAAKDIVGNDAQAPTGITTYTIDNTGPTIAEITAIPTPDDDITPNYTFSSDEAGVITYGGSCSSATADAVAGPNTITFDELSDGTYDTCTITVTDTAGNLSNLLNISAFIIDTTAPVTTDNVPAGWQTSDVTVTLTCDDSIGGNSGCLKVYYTTDGNDPTTASSFVSAADGWSFTISTDGEYTVKYRGEDAVGNLEEVKTAINSLQLDKTAPVITNLAPSNGSVTSDATPTISADFTESGSAVNLGSISIFVDGVSRNTFATKTGSNVSYTPASAMADGIHNVVVNVSDNAGNPAIEANWSFEVAGSITLVTVTTDKADVPVDGVSQAKITAQVLDNGVPVTTGDVAFNSVIGDITASPVSLSGDGKAITYISSTEIGETTVTASINLGSGLISGTVKVNFTKVDAIAPAATTQWPADNATNVSTTTQPYVNFSELMDESTLTSDNVQLREYDSATGIPATLNISTNGDGTTRVTFEPVGGLLDEGTQYYFYISSAAKDLADNSVDPAWTVSNKSNHEFTTLADHTPVTSYDIPLYAGWNLISLPLIPSNPDIETVLADISSNVNLVKYYDDAVAGDWLSYVPGFGGDLTIMEDGKGYWIDMEEADTLTVTGVEMPGPAGSLPSYSILSGWNLVGFKSVVSMKSSEYFLGVDYTLVYDYNGGYSVVASINPVVDNNLISGFGYWLYTTTAGSFSPPLR